MKCHPIEDRFVLNKSYASGPPKRIKNSAGLIYPQMSSLGQAWLSGKMRVGSRTFDPFASLLHLLQQNMASL